MKRQAPFIVTTALLLASSVGQLSAQSRDSLNTPRRGILFSLKFLPHLSSPTAFARGGYCASLGVGYMIGSDMMLGINFFTGREEVPHTAGVPIPGMFDAGGGECAFNVYLSGGIVRPFAGIGYGLFTMLDGGMGYNGGGPHVECGAQLNISPRVSFDCSVQLRRLWMHNIVADDAFAPLFHPIGDTLLALSLGVNFYPNIYP